MWFETGVIEASRHGKAFKVYALDKNGEKIFIGLVTRRALSTLIQNLVLQADVCQFAETKEQIIIPELNFSLRLQP